MSNLRIGCCLGLGLLIARTGRATPIAAFGGGGGAYARMRSGWFLGADTGVATLLSSDADQGPQLAAMSTAPSYHALAFGARAGYEWPSGLALQARLDDLGVHTGDGPEGMTFATVGLRYSIPFPLMPFADVLAGPAFDASGTSFGAAVGVGVSILITRHLGVDLALRDWMADLDGGIRNIPTVTVGIQLGFGR